jgi:hypothetical protein
VLDATTFKDADAMVVHLDCDRDHDGAFGTLENFMQPFIEVKLFRGDIKLFLSHHERCVFLHHKTILLSKVSHMNDNLRIAFSTFAAPLSIG